MLWYVLVPLGIGVLIAMAAGCGLPRRDNFYFTETGEPRSW
jgi:hypothetical protein